MPEKPRTVLFVPAGGAGEGMGHLARCVRLAQALRGRTEFLATRVDSAAQALLSQELRGIPAARRPRLITRIPPSGSWDLIVVDARRTSRGEVASLAAHGPVVCLDEGGDASETASFLVDTIPGLPGRRSANLSSPSYMDLPRRVRRGGAARHRGPLRLLVTFGGEDRDDLSGTLLAALPRAAAGTPLATTVVEGPLFSARAWPEIVRVIKGAASLDRSVAASDLVITHFGITAFRALAAGVPVVLLNPSRYHARLGAAAGFPTIGTRRVREARLAGILRDPAAARATVERFNERIGSDRGRHLPRLLQQLRRRGTGSCPVCGDSGHRVSARFADRTYRRCDRCRILYLESFAAAEKRYGRAYFAAEYKAQYGRTYLEDFETIRAACHPRVKVLRELLGAAAKGSVLDVGCAYGPFLAALEDGGLDGFGLDVSADAVAWVRRELHRPAVRARFEDIAPAALPREIAAITLWYVIEHFSDAGLVLRKAAALLPAGGVLAFSTPNGRGISARRSLVEFLRQSPGDHFTVFSPRGLSRLLRMFGFTLRRVRVTGHHPERFPGILGAAAARVPAARIVLGFVSRAAGLGDTFEAYAVKGED